MIWCRSWLHNNDDLRYVLVCYNWIGSRIDQNVTNFLLGKFGLYIVSWRKWNLRSVQWVRTFIFYISTGKWRVGKCWLVKSNDEWFSRKDELIIYESINYGFLILFYLFLLYLNYSYYSIDFGSSLTLYYFLAYHRHQ